MRLRAHAPLPGVRGAAFRSVRRRGGVDRRRSARRTFLVLFAVALTIGLASHIFGRPILGPHPYNPYAAILGAAVLLGAGAVFFFVVVEGAATALVAGHLSRFAFHDAPARLRLQGAVLGGGLFALLPAALWEVDRGLGLVATLCFCLHGARVGRRAARIASAYARLLRRRRAGARAAAPPPAE